MDRTHEEPNDCTALEEELAAAASGDLEGDLAAHLADCDRCRDLVHDARRAIAEVRALSEQWSPGEDLEEQLLAAIDARAAAREGSPEAGRLVETVDAPKTATGATAANDADTAIAAPNGDAGASHGGLLRRIARAPRSLQFAGLLAAAAGVLLVIAAPGDSKNGTVPWASRAPWQGTVAAIVGADDGLLVDGRPIAVGATVPRGARIQTDPRTRARIGLDDGSRLVLDRGAEIVLDGAHGRGARVVRGAVVLEPSTSEESIARLELPSGAVETRGGKLAISILDEGVTSVALARGSARIVAGGTRLDLGVGEGAHVGRGEVRPTGGGLSAAFAWSELETRTIETGADVPGIGSLRARRPGSTDDGDRPLRLARQRVEVRIAGDLARTQIDQTFASDAPEVLEGIYRFPLPPDAQIERLALEVDGHLEEGSFVDRERAAAIFRGVIAHSTPRPIPKAPQEERIWVPGPWHDPALLEWRAGGRMELRIFPIPARSSRRVILAYTQRVPESGGTRRYVYPLPQFGAASASAIEDFGVDLQILGHDPARGVALRGYDAASANEGAVVRRTVERRAFVPSGDLVVEYARRDPAATVTSWAHRAYDPITKGTEGFVALRLAPKLPRLGEDRPRNHVVVVDASRSMVGERWARASAVVERFASELDPRDQVTVLACDYACRPLGGPRLPGPSTAEALHRALAAVEVDGASDPAAAIAMAAQLARTDQKRSPRVVYVGDGAATIGARTPAALETSVRAAAAEAQVTAVAIGVDADLSSLESIARGGGGVVIPYVGGRSVGEVALDLLEASSGVILRDPVLELPDGLHAVAPRRLGALRAGGETMVVARMARSTVSGNATLRGSVAGRPWSTTFPLEIHEREEAGNAFVPRTWASATIAELERQPTPDRARIVELSKTWSVPSRFTSMIVLESPAMAAAFGVEPPRRGGEWTGEVPADSVAHASGEEKEALAAAAPGGGGRAAIGAAAPAPASVPTVAAKNEAAAEERVAGPRPAFRPKPCPPGVPLCGAKSGGIVGDEVGRWMKREWYRTATLEEATTPELDLESRIANARAATISAPDSRDKIAALFGLLVRRSSLDDARTTLESWLARDPLDVPATFRRSELLAAEGDRARAMRALTAALEARPDDVALADGLAEVATRVGEDRLACALRAIHAELRPNDVEAVARRVGCVRAAGEHALATSILDGLGAGRRGEVEMRAASTSPSTIAATGDLMVDATWYDADTAIDDSLIPTGALFATAHDLDLAVVDPKGVRRSLLSPSDVRIADARTPGRESLAIPWAGAGTWTIEVTRSHRADVGPITGNVRVRVLGQTRSWPFVLHGSRAIVGRVRIGWASRWVPG